MFKVTISNTTAPLSSDEEALRAIIEANYNFAWSKYKDSFDSEKVRSYICVRLATKALCDKGYVIHVQNQAASSV